MNVRSRIFEILCFLVVGLPALLLIFMFSGLLMCSFSFSRSNKRIAELSLQETLTKDEEVELLKLEMDREDYHRALERRCYVTQHNGKFRH